MRSVVVRVVEVVNVGVVLEVGKVAKDY